MRCSVFKFLNNSIKQIFTLGSIPKINIALYTTSIKKT